MSREEPPPPLRTITEFAAQQAEFLKHLFRLKTDGELANLSVLKLQEEAGEVAEAYLALQSLQRRDKLKRPRRELKDALGKEIADVAVVMALLADAIGLAFDEIMLERIEDLRARREKLLAEMEPNGNGTTYKRNVPSPTETDQDRQLPLFAD